MDAKVAEQTGDRAFWPPQPRLFDLTLKFEETIMGIMPSVVMAAMSPFLIAHYSHEPVRVRRSWHLWAKMAVAIALAGVEIASLVCRTAAPDFRTSTTLPAASLELLTAFTVAMVLYYEHLHTVRSTAVLGVYFFLALVIDAIKCRSYFIRYGLVANGVLAAAACALRFIILALQELPKRSLLLDAELKKIVGDEAGSGFWSRSFLLYLNPLFLTGYRSILEMQHLSNLGPELSSSLLHARLRHYWLQKTQGPRASLALTCFKAWKAHALAIFIPRLASIGFNFAQPFIIFHVINLVESGKPDPTQRGALLGATLISYIGSTLTNMMTAHLCYRLVTQIRGGIVAQLFEKTLRLPQSEAKKSAAVTLMSADIDGIADGVRGIYEVFMTTLEIALGTYLLSGFVGRSCFVVFIPIALSTVITYFLGNWISSALAAWNESLQFRVAETAKILGQLTAIRAFGLGPTFEAYLQKMREREVAASSKHRCLTALTTIPVVGADLMTPVVVIAAALFWRTMGGKFSAATVFPSLSIISLIKHPFATLLGSYPRMRSMMKCLDRIERFLLLEERSDPRTVVAHSSEESNPELISAQPIIKFVKAKIAPVGTEIPILRDLDFSLLPGSVTAVAGVNGAGKSSLLQGILGETELLDGSIEHTDTAIGFCDQTVWLRNISIKDNILGPLPYDDALFKRVVKCVLLDEDFRRLRGGADYVVGSGGSKLSGGQRQRVGLARTLYARMSLVVLDDVFSALDRKTALSILCRLCGENGLLKEINCAAIIATTLSECIDLADQVLVLDGNGQAKVQNRSQLTESRENIFQGMNLTQSFKSSGEEAQEQEAIRTSLDARKSINSEQQSTTRQKDGNFSLYHLYIKQIGYPRLVSWCLALLVSSSGEIFPEIYMRLWLDRHPEERIYFIGYAAIAVVTCFFLSATSMFLYGDLTPRAALGLYKQLVMTVMRATLGFLGGMDNGEILNRFSQDMTILVRNLPYAFMRTFYALFLSMLNTGVILAGASYMALILPGILVVIYFIQRFYLKTSRQLRTLDLETKSPLYTHFEETAEGLLHIRAFGWMDSNLQEALTLLDESQKAFYYLYCIQLWLSFVLGLLSAVMSGVLVAFALFIRYSSSGSAIGLSLLNLMAFSDCITALILAWTNLETSISAMHRLRELMDTTPQERSQSLVQLPHNWPSRGYIQLKNCYAAYSDNVEKHAILKDLTLSVEAGSKVGFVGRTGSGKSSLFMALLGFLKYNGAMKIDGIDVSSIAPDELRSRIVTISQAQLQIEASVRVNLLPFTINDPPPTDEKGKEEARKKNIELRELLISLGIWSHVNNKGGLDAMLSAVGYSHGEMQLFCLARGILRCRETGSRLVLIDEATSSVAHEREKAAQNVMKEYFSDCTVLVIGHRKSSIRGVNYTVELAGGQIVHLAPTEPDSDEEITSARDHLRQEG